MKAEIKFVKTKDFISTTASGELNLEESKNVLNKLAALIHPDEQHDILVDIRDTVSVLTLSDIYELVTEIGRHRSSFRNKVAILLADHHDFDKAVFLEMCAGNRGFSVNTFTEFEEAVNWLMCHD
ncbi:MAG TPA: hypothetical protein PKA39_14150 [Ignavibacteria bacterium]|jgi:hypothetical protein|nr:hypothetical protein [Ignavibacteria bacterium]